MLSKSMPLRSAPQVGMGFMPNTLRALSRFLSIHSGSFLSFEMSVTTSSETPRLADAPALSESDQPNSYWPRFESSGRSISTSDMGYLLSAAANHSARTGIVLRQALVGTRRCVEICRPVYRRGEGNAEDRNLDRFCAT